MRLYTLWYTQHGIERRVLNPAEVETTLKEKVLRVRVCKNQDPLIVPFQNAVVESTSMVGTIDAMNLRKTTR